MQQCIFSTKQKKKANTLGTFEQSSHWRKKTIAKSLHAKKASKPAIVLACSIHFFQFNREKSRTKNSACIKNERIYSLSQQVVLNAVSVCVFFLCEFERFCLHMWIEYVDLRLYGFFFGLVNMTFQVNFRYMQTQSAQEREHCVNFSYHFACKWMLLNKLKFYDR